MLLLLELLKLLAAGLLGLGGGLVLGVQLVSDALSDFFSASSIANFTPAATKLLDKATVGGHVANTIHHTANEKTLLELGCSIGVIGEDILNELAEAEVSGAVGGGGSSSANDIVRSWNKVESERLSLGNKGTDGRACGAGGRVGHNTLLGLWCGHVVAGNDLSFELRKADGGIHAEGSHWLRLLLLLLLESNVNVEEVHVHVG